MREFITPYTVANQARMRNPKDKAKARVFIEGDDDYRIYQHLIAVESCILIPSTGRSNAIGAVQLLRKEGWTGVLALVDRDFDALDGVDVSGPDVVVTDDHDAEMILLRSRALEKVLVEYSIAGDADQIRTTLLQAAKPLGCFRWVSIQENLRLDFNDLNFNEFIDPQTLAPDETHCATAVIRNTRGCALTTQILLIRTKSALEAAHDLWQACCGHDTIPVLALLVERHLKRPQHPATVARSLRLAFEFAHFEKTKLCAAIRTWERANSRWRILREA